MGFGKSKGIVDKYGTGGNWVTLKQGDAVKVVFLGDELWAPARYTGKAYEACWPKTSGDGIGVRFASSVYLAGGPGSSPQDNVKYLEGPLTLYAAIDEAFSDPDVDGYNTIFKVTKVNDKKYTVTPIKQITSAQAETLSGLKPIDLGKSVKWLKDVDLDEVRKWNASEESGDDTAAASEEPEDDIAF